MRSLIVGMLLTALPSTAYSQVPWHWDVTNVPDGTYLVTKSGNTFEFVPIRVTVVNPGPTPPGPVPPNPAPDTLAGKTEKWAREINAPMTCRNLAIAFATVVVRAEQGAFQTKEEIDAARSAAGAAVLNTEELKTKWKPWSDHLRDEFIAMSQEGKLQTVEQYTAALTQVRDGLIAASSNVESLDEITVEKILEVVKAVIEAIGDKELTIVEIFDIVTLVLQLFK